MSVEIDETYLGARPKTNISASAGHRTFAQIPRLQFSAWWSAVAASLPRDEGHLSPIIAERVPPASTVYTDCYTTYDKLGEGYQHHHSNHSEKI